LNGINQAIYLSGRRRCRNPKEILLGTHCVPSVHRQTWLQNDVSSRWTPILGNASDQQPTDKTDEKQVSERPRDRKDTKIADSGLTPFS
jgi:hypothetical protein